jgi:long-chain acyl-CoA synthetase
MLHDFTDVTERGRAFEREQADAASNALASPKMDDIGVMVFTSGSTGKPKAAMTTWRSLSAAAHGLNTQLGCADGDALVSYLPLCHMAEQMFSIHIPLTVGANVNFAESLRTIQEDLREIAPQVFFGVPRIWEKFHASIQTKLREAGGLRAWLYARAMSAMESTATKPRNEWSGGEKVRWALWYWLILRSLLNFVGLRRCRVAISSGAPVAPDILKFFRVLGVPIREAYGLTESSGAICMQPSDRSPVGTVGVPYMTARSWCVAMSCSAATSATTKRPPKRSMVMGGCAPVTSRAGRKRRPVARCGSSTGRKTS